MRMPTGNVLLSGVIFVAAAIYGFTRVPTLDEPMSLYVGVAAGFVLLTGLLLLARFRWSPELYALVIVGAMALFVRGMIVTGFSYNWLVGLVGGAFGLTVYPALRQEVRAAPVVDAAAPPVEETPPTA
jgi:hypothetical protein